MHVVARIDATGNGIGLVVVHVVMQLAIAAAKLLLLEEERVVHEGEGIEDVEARLFAENQGVIDECVEARLVVAGGGDWGNANGRCVVVEICSADSGMLRRSNDG